MFVNEDSNVFASFGEARYNGDPFATVVRDTRGTKTREIHQGNGSAMPYIGRAGE